MNVLLIIVEDWSSFAIGAYGNTVVQTPNVDRLAAKGVMFTRAYCQGTVCNPARASLMTGLHPDSTKVYGNSEAMDKFVPERSPSLPRVLGQREEVWLGTIGKLVHKLNEAERFLIGFDLNESTHEYDRVAGFRGEQRVVRTPHGAPVWAEEEALRLPEPHGARLQELRAERDAKLRAGAENTWPLRQPFQQYHAEMVGDSSLEEEEMEDGRIARRAVDLLGDLAQREASFFLSVGLYATPTPALAPKEYVDRYDRETCC